MDDLNLFNVYPWSTFYWMVTYRSTHDIFNGRASRYSSQVEKKKAKREEKYNVGGCPFSFFRYDIKHYSIKFIFCILLSMNIISWY